MTEDPACCTPNTTLDQVAKLMIQNDCGEIPVVDVNDRPVGVVTDRDIVCRVVAAGKNPIAWGEPLTEVGELVREVSRDMGRESR